MAKRAEQTLSRLPCSTASGNKSLISSDQHLPTALLVGIKAGEETSYEQTANDGDQGATGQDDRREEERRVGIRSGVTTAQAILLSVFGGQPWRSASISAIRLRSSCDWDQLGRRPDA
jgi:hypothetical protein